MMPTEMNQIVAIGTMVIGLICLLSSVLLVRKAKLGRELKLTEVLAQGLIGNPGGDVLSQILTGVILDTRATAGYILTASNPDSEELKLDSFYSHDPSFEPVQTLSVDQGISGLVFRNQQLLSVRAKDHHALIQQEFQTAPTSVLAVPIKVANGSGSEQQSIGVLCLVGTKSGDRFSKDALAVAGAYAKVLSLEISQLQMTRFAQETVFSSLEEIADLLDAKDPYTAGHSRRTAKIAEKIAAQLGTDKEVIAEIRNGAKLLDIGKVAIPDTILKKEGGLTGEELELVKQHPLVSYSICKKLMLPESVLLLVRNHHERLDGTGYPDHLQGGELPLAVRIIGVADAFDAMRCARHHRESMSIEQAISQLLRDAGTKFDPMVIEALRELAEQGALDLVYTQGSSSEAEDAWAA
jgi:HD-GYP domain-containing protein (c-di-GMP phosphodiesterase class II)